MVETQPTLTCKRDLFGLEKHVHYLNCAYMSPKTKRAVEIGISALDSHLRPYEYQVTDFFEPVENIKRDFAALIGAEHPDRVAMIPSVSYAIATVANNVALKEGQNIVAAAGQFPSNVYAWQDLCDRTGAELRLVQRSSTYWTNDLLQAIDENTRVLALGHVHWADGTVFDLVRLSEKVRAVGGLVIIDGTQSVGALPFPFDAVKPDALICAGYKWLLSPYGIGVAYYGPAFDDQRPIEFNWINRLDSHDFKGLVDYNPEYRPMANRYSVGENSNFLLVPLLAEGLRTVLEWTPGAINSYARNLVAKFSDKWLEMGFKMPTNMEFSPHLFGIGIPEGVSPASLHELCSKHQVSVSLRGNSIRVSIHAFNTSEDLEALTEVLHELSSP